MPVAQNHSGEIIALDIGDSKIGVARANTIAKIPEPLPVLKNDDNFLESLKMVIAEYSAILLVIGLPHNSNGQETAQTLKIRSFCKKILEDIKLEIVFVDESYTSVDADNYLAKNKKTKYDQDSIAACYILNEYFRIGG